MWETRELLIFAAGAQTFHAFSHLILPLFLKLPLEVNFFGWRFQFTRQWNVWATVFNFAVALLLIWGASSYGFFNV